MYKIVVMETSNNRLFLHQKITKQKHLVIITLSVARKHLLHVKMNVSQSEELTIIVEYIVQNIDLSRYVIFKWCLFCLMFLMTTISAGVYGCIWHYERYGGDPQKRTVLNQLVGELAKTTIFCNIASGSTLLLRLAYQPLPESFAKLAFFLPISMVFVAWFVILDEIVIIRFLAIFWWKRMPPINDNFFGSFLCYGNYGLILVFLTWGYFFGSPSGNLAFILTGIGTQGVPTISMLTSVIV